MKAVVKTERSYGKLEVQNVPKPQAGPGEVLVKIKAVGVCGSDVHIYKYDSTYHHIPIPLIIGHEYAGVIEEVGPGVTDWKIGDKVMGEAVAPCDRCVYCRTGLWEVCVNRIGLGVANQGMMKEYAIIPLNILHDLPEGLDFPEAVVAQPCAVAVHAIERTPLGKGGEAVAIFGPGIIGISAALACKEKGADMVILFGTDADEKIRLSAARKLGIEAVNLSNESPKEALMRIMKRNIGVDVVLECSGAQKAITDGLSILKKGGTLMEVGLPTGPVTIDIAGMIRSEINYLTSYSGTWYDYERAIHIMYKNREQLGRFVSKYPLDHVIQAFEDSVQMKTLKSVILFD